MKAIMVLLVLMLTGCNYPMGYDPCFDSEGHEVLVGDQAYIEIEENGA